MISIEIEDGSCTNARANSYVTLEELEGYAKSRGLPLQPIDYAPLLLRAIDFLESQRGRYKGEKTQRYQPLQWPRVGVGIDGYFIHEHKIPRELKHAQIVLALEAFKVDLQPTLYAEKETAKEKIEGVVEIEYAPLTIKKHVFSKADALLSPLYKKATSYFKRS